jgi:hypothetical protein
MATPIVAGHFLLTEDKENGSWDNIPKKWSHIRFDTIDVLYVSPFNVLPGPIFGLEGGNENNRTGNLTKRFEWVVREARTQNPKVRIIAVQMIYRGGDFCLENRRLEGEIH